MQTKDPNLTKTPKHKTTDSVQAESETELKATDNKGSSTLTDEKVDSEHVNEGDNPARQPDRRDQQGSSAFDSNLNQDTNNIAPNDETTETPQSDEITDRNRYATLDNAQTRVLDEDSK